MPLKFLLDENLRSGALWQAIGEHQRLGTHPLEIMRVGDVGCAPLGSSDDAILQWAAAQSRVLISQDAKSIEAALVGLNEAGTASPGVILLRKGYTVPEMLELLVFVAYCSEPHEWQDAIRWIP